MARKRSTPDSSQKQSKIRYADESIWERVRLAPDAADKQKEDRDRTDALRQRDKDFIAETAKIKARLLELRKANPNLFKSLFQTGSYLAAFRPDAIAELMAEAKDEDQKRILKDFWFYTARFRVWLGWDRQKGDFKKPSAFPPHATKYRARLVNGQLEEMEPFAPELPYESEYEDGNLSVPDPAVEQWMAGGRAVLVRLEDAEGYSLLNEIESFAYDPNAVTLIVHDSVMPYLFLLVGEMATVEEVRAAGKVLTALHKRFFGRSKAGKPKDIAKYLQALQKLKEKDGKSQREKAAELVPPEEYKKTAADLTKKAAQMLSKTKKTIQPRPTR
jgi:hypothetical protein